MKFKKVKIQAFRAYNRVEDGTFDFNISQNSNEDIADFVSIYAPNGFGKTSFYDAVEYGFTESISRFLKNLKLNRDAAKSERVIAANKKGQNILRNRFATDDFSTEIKIYTTNSANPIEKTVPKNKRKDGTDFDFDESKVKNKFFQSVILSQEWVDAFLKVDDPNDRYNKFVEYFGDSSIDEYYKKLIELIALNEKRIEEIKEALKGIQTQLDFDGDRNILKKVNDKIVELKNSGEPVNIIDSSFDEKVSLSLSNTISERISDISFEKTKSEALSSFIDITFSGNEERKNIEMYFDAKVKIEDLKVKEKTLKNNFDQFLRRKKLSVEIDNITETQKKLLLEKESLEEIQKLFPVYLKIKEEIDKKGREIGEAKKNMDPPNNLISELRLKEKSSQTKITNLNKQIKDLETEIEALPKSLAKFNVDENRLKELRSEIDLDDEITKSIEKSAAGLQQEISNISIALDELKKGQFPSIFESEFISLKDLVIEIEKIEKEIKDKREELGAINLKIQSQETLNKDIAQFIAKGAEIIDKNQGSTCPLCSHEYDSYIELADKVAKNTLLSNLISKYLEERRVVESQIHEFYKNFNEKIEILENSLNTALTERKEKILYLKETLSKMQVNKAKLIEEYNEVVLDIQNYNSILNGITYEERGKDLSLKLNKLKDDLRQIAEDLIKCQADINTETLKVSALLDKIEVFNSDVKTLMGDNDSLKVITYFHKVFPDEIIEIRKIADKIDAEAKKINDNKFRSEELLKQISEIDDLLKSSTEDIDRKELELVIRELQTLQQVVVAFEQEVSSILSIEIGELNKEELTDELNQKKAHAKSEIDKYDRKVKEYGLLIELKKNVAPFLKYEQAKKIESELKVRLSGLEENVSKCLNDEKLEVTRYLDEQINSFFYQDLINDLYRRIDPHPDYKKIKFICDFKDDRPKLNICLYKDDNSDDLIIPNLYFSTAQLNILSLSIFLAKALNTKDHEGNSVNCIFIDDPIQSMDSINILSTIDLFRSLVINEKKQIILSTHDENFHNLLQKKMPPSHFKSKFMELQSFGKVKL